MTMSTELIVALVFAAVTVALAVTGGVQAVIHDRWAIGMGLAAAGVPVSAVGLAFV